MKHRSLLPALFLLFIGITIGGTLYVSAQEEGGQNLLASLMDRFQQPEKTFDYAAELNPSDNPAELKSEPVEGKKKGGKLTAAEFNRVLEMLNEGGSGSGGGQEIVCGGYMNKYGLGYVAGSNWGCAVPDSAAVACPAGYVDIQSSAPTINLAEQVHLCVLEYGGGNPGDGNGWVNIDINGTDEFNESCNYRFKRPVVGAREPYTGNSPWYHVNAVSSTQLTWWFNPSDTHHISHDSKTVYRINGAEYAPAGGITEIQMNCGGGGGTPSGGGGVEYGWVKPQPGSSNGANFIYWPANSGDHSATQTCKDAGYDDYVGPCRSVGGGLEISGTIAANTLAGFWTMSCNYGNGAWIMSENDHELLCMKKSEGSGGSPISSGGSCPNGGLHPDFPDAIQCDNGTDWEYLYLMQLEAPDNEVWYGSVGTNSSTRIKFDIDTGAYVESDNSGDIEGFDACRNKTLSQLESEGKTFDFCGGGSESNSGGACPAGFVKVGSFCIEPNMSNPGKDFYEAGAECAAKGAQLCSWSEWSTACEEGVLTDVLFGPSGKYEWIDSAVGHYDWVTIANPKLTSNCKDPARTSSTIPVEPTGFRCCSPAGGGGEGSSTTNTTTNGGDTMIENWPDAISCFDASKGKELILPLVYVDEADNIEVRYQSTNETGKIFFNLDGSYEDHNNMSDYDCVQNTWSITQLYQQQKAYNFLGDGGSGGSACSWKNAATTMTASEYESAGGTGTCKWTDNGETYYGYVSGGTTEFWVSNYRAGVGTIDGEPIMFCRQFDEDPSSLDTGGTLTFSYYACK